MIEIYLFIHPLCPSCLTFEKKTLDTIQTNRQKIQFKFLPFLNFQHFQNFLANERSTTISLQERNDLFRNSYDAALDYKAMLLQGKKKGRAFLFAIQEEVGIKHKTYTASLANEMVCKVKGDLAMFHADRQSDLVKESFNADQTTAREMNVSKSGSMVVFNYTSDQDYGILIEEDLPTEVFKELLVVNKPSLLDDSTDKGIIRHTQMGQHPPLKLLEN